MILSTTQHGFPEYLGNGLKLNVSQNDNSQDLSLAPSVAKHFRLSSEAAQLKVIAMKKVVSEWQKLAEELSISRAEQIKMKRASRLSES